MSLLAQRLRRHLLMLLDIAAAVLLVAVVVGGIYIAATGNPGTGLLVAAAGSW